MKPATLFILISMVIDAMGWGLMIPVAPQLIMDLTGTDLAGAAPIAGYLMVTFAAMQFVFAPVVGALSDHFGRRPVLLVSMAALALDYLLMSVAPFIGWLFLGRAIAGIAGATYPTANAVITDVHPAAERAKYFGMIGAAWGIGFILGPALGGVLAGVSTRAPFVAAASLALLNFLLGVAVFPETLDKHLRRPVSIARVHLVGSLRQLSHHRGLLMLMAVIFLYQLAHDAMPSTWSFFSMRQYSWTPRDVGISLAVVGVTTAIVQGGLIGPVTRRFGEPRAATLGFVAGIVSMAGYAFATQGWMAYVLISIGALFGLAMPAMQSMMSSQVPADAQGELQGAIAGFQSISAIIAPIFMTQLFHWSTRPEAGAGFPGAPMLVAAILLMAAGALFAVAMRRLRTAEA
jgi:DHA1 family tetracycline resistance protein-like MFS transporter